MNSWTALAKLAAGPTGPEARTHPRFKAGAIACDHGEVLDFSATGLRIRFRKCPRYQAGQVAELTLQTPRGEHRCRAEVVWVRKAGRRATEVGFHFPDEQTAERVRLFRAQWDPLNDSDWITR